ncbi:MAG: hypothetical protein KDC84_12570 [Crocinitomicaceae bacterium]|nr:hypothetical protein [Crocinitomicaceae bacterium]
MKKVQKATSSNLFEFESFGYGIDFSGNTAIVGTFDIRWIGKHMWVGRDSIPGGRAYILERNSEGIWVEKQVLTSPDKHYEDCFGERGVAISGNYAIVSASHHEYDPENKSKVTKSGAAYIYEKDKEGIWQFKQKVVAFDRNPKGQFGLWVEIDGEYAFVGTPWNNTDSQGNKTMTRAGAVFVYKRDTEGRWNPFQKLTASDRSSNASFGFSCSVSENYMCIGAYAENATDFGQNITKAGAAYIFKKNDQGVWVETQKLVSTKRAAYGSFGGSVCLNGKQLIVGAQSEPSWSENGDSLKQTGAAYIFELSKYGTWDFKQKITACEADQYDNFGAAVGITDNRILVGIPYDEVIRNGKKLPNAGSAQFFEKEDGKWVRTQRVISADPEAGQRFGEYLILADEFAGISEHLDGTVPINTVDKNKTGAVYFYGEFPTEKTCEPPTYELVDYQHPNPPPPDVFTPEIEDIAITETIVDTIHVEPVIEEPEGEVPIFTLSPNPTTGKFQLNILNYDGGQYKLILKTPQSREIEKKNFTTKILELDLSREKDGTYIVKVSNRFGNLQLPIVLKKIEQTTDPNPRNNGL